MWKNEEDVLNTLDELSVFTKNQDRIRRLRIKSSKTEHRKKLKDSKREEKHAENAEEDTDEICTGDSDNTSVYSLLEVSNVNSVPMTVGRAQQINHYKQLKRLLSKEKYIHREVQIVAGCYSNDSIEQNYQASVNANRQYLDCEAASKTSEDSDSQFDDVEESSSVISSDELSAKENATKELNSSEKLGKKCDRQSRKSRAPASKSNELSAKENAASELSSSEKLGETCDSQSRMSPALTLDKSKPEAPVQPSTDARPPLKTKPVRQRNALLLSLQKKMAENERSLETDTKDTVSENSAVTETDKKNSMCEDSTILESVKKDSTSGKIAVSNEDCKNGNVWYRLSSLSEIVEFTPRKNIVLAYNPSTHTTYNPGSDVVCNPDEGVEDSCGSSEKNDVNKNEEHYPKMGVEHYHTTGVEHYSSVDAEQYHKIDAQCYSNTGVGHCLGGQYFPDSGITLRPNANHNPCTYYPIANSLCYPSRSQDYNKPEHLTGKSVWYAPKYNRSDYVFTPTEKIVTEFKYKEEEFPPL